MNLQSELDELSKRIASFREPQKVSDQDWNSFASKAVVALTAGGEGSRYAAALEGQKVNKNVHELPNGDTMIEMTIRMYRDVGIKKFVALVFHSAHSVEDRLGDGSSLGVEIVYSHDPKVPVGRGGAIRNALENGSIPEDCNLIVANPCDIFLNFPDSLVRYIGSAHIEGEKKNMMATAVLAPGLAYTATAMVIDDNQVIDTQMFPHIPIPAHAGITIFSPKILPRFKELFDLSKTTDFEQVLFPLLTNEKKLWSVVLKKGSWIAVKDLKSYKQLVKMLGDS